MPSKKTPRGQLPKIENANLPELHAEGEPDVAGAFEATFLACPESRKAFRNVLARPAEAPAPVPRRVPARAAAKAAKRKVMA